MTKLTIKDIVIRCCLILLVLLMITVVARFFTKQVLVDRFGIDNSFTKLLFHDATNLQADELAIPIDWISLYPHRNFEHMQTKKASRLKEMLNVYTGSINGIKDVLELYSTNNLFGYTSIVFAGRLYSKALGWNISALNDYNSVIDLGDGYWTTYIEKKDVQEHVNAVAELMHYCDKRNIDFLFVQAPYKISKYEDSNISGTMDFSNQNADEFLSEIGNNNVNYLDIRGSIVSENLCHHDLFYKTDHHWKAETGLWAAGLIASKLNEDYGFTIDTSLFSENNYRKEIYKDWFLGSQGKKATLARAKTEDFSLLYPAFSTDINLQIPSLEIDQSGNFEIFYDMRQVDERAPMKLNPYATYCYGDRPVTTINNYDLPNSKRILFIRDSFSNCTIPFLSLGVEELYSLDIRHFTGSVKAYIDSVQPDVVIVQYNAGSIGGPIDYISHADMFDFR